jgi:hypothetical protein
MWQPRRLTILWASMACYRDSFSLFTSIPMQYPSKLLTSFKSSSVKSAGLLQTTRSFNFTDQHRKTWRYIRISKEILSHVPNVWTFETVIVFKYLETTVTNKSYTHEDTKRKSKYQECLLLFSSEFLIFPGYRKRREFLDYWVTTTYFWRRTQLYENISWFLSGPRLFASCFRYTLFAIY